MIAPSLEEQSHHCHNAHEVTQRNMGQIDRYLMTTKLKNKRIAYKKMLGMRCINVSIIPHFSGAPLINMVQLEPSLDKQSHTLCRMKLLINSQMWMSK